ncbi:histidine--tRNA ligase [Candidatus Woesearchaeota archaeon]|nr:histidine--tRNA ligase [Candidatus Woesearchaeota archaeon]
MDLQLAKGTRDFAPEEKILRMHVESALQASFEEFGFNPLETPVLERWETLSSKYAGGAEILKESFRLKDQGDRELGLRYDLTVPFSRFVGMNPELKMPFKRYQMGPVFRDGPIKLGRYREFWQCDVDVVGVKSVLADAELLAVAQTVFRKLELPVTLKVNHRKLLNGVLAACGVREKLTETILCLDKLEKVGPAEVKKELAALGVSGSDALLPALSRESSNEKTLAKLRALMRDDEGGQGLAEVEELLRFCSLLGVEVQLEPSLARGLAYYTGPVFEAFLRDSQITSSVAGGGRYDGMIGQFLGRGEHPATGISFGLEVITDALRLSGRKFPKSVVQVYVIPIKAQDEALAILAQLRAKGIRADIEQLSRGISKSLEYAAAMGIPYVLLIGQKELKEGKVRLRDMRSGEEKLLTADEAAAALS